MEFPVFQFVSALHCPFTGYHCGLVAPSLHSSNGYLCKFTRSITTHNSALFVFMLFKNTSAWEFLVARIAVQWIIYDSEICHQSQYRRLQLSPILVQSFLLLNCSSLVQAQVSVQLHGETIHSAQKPSKSHFAFVTTESLLQPSLLSVFIRDIHLALL